jgi:ABC-type sulfate transport system substrate-binding protein
MRRHHLIVRLIVSAALVAFIVPNAANAQVVLLNVSYDPTREFYQELNTAFAQAWQAKTGTRVTINQSHAEPTSGAFKATVVHVNRAGPSVKIELLAEWGDPVFVEISPERCDQLKLARDAVVFISPQSHDLFVRE